MKIGMKREAGGDWGSEEGWGCNISHTRHPHLELLLHDMSGGLLPGQAAVQHFPERFSRFSMQKRTCKFLGRAPFSRLWLQDLPVRNIAG